MDRERTYLGLQDHEVFLDDGADFLLIPGPCERKDDLLIDGSVGVGVRRKKRRKEMNK